MPHLDHAILSTLIYYDLLDRPLTTLEIYKYLFGPSQEASFFEFQKSLEDLVTTKKIEQGTGLYFLPNRSNQISVREKRLKLAQVKWRKLKKLVRWLALVPFLRMVAVTGSLTAYNTKLESDFDLLIVAKAGRLWLTRTFVTALTALLGARRHDQITKDRICLNCYLTEDGLEIKPEAKPRDFHSAQEYGRLTLLFETEKGVYQKFIASNFWLKEYLNFYPWPPHQSIGVGAWPIQKTSKAILISGFMNRCRRLAESLLAGKIGDRLENKLGVWQKRRISLKSEDRPSDQIFVSQNCLMFHPQSKSYSLMQKFERQLVEINKA